MRCGWTSPRARRHGPSRWRAAVLALFGVAGAVLAGAGGCGAAPSRGAPQKGTVPAVRAATAEISDMTLERATFAAGCFWGVEELFRQTPGVVRTTVGYTGGHTPNPTYKQVCTGTTGHAEAVLVEFDPGQVSYAALLDVFWKGHNPTTRNRQGPDVGEQYRSAVFCHSPAQETAARASRDALAASGRFKAEIVTEIVPAVEFYAAEEYHQQYLAKKGLASCHVPTPE
jgi:peptide-methionine (S)-S-oxide reductase